MAPKTVLVVDDHEDSRQICNHLLTHFGYRVLLAGTSAEATSLAVAHEPHLILMDFRLPDGDGVETLRQLREHESLAATKFVLYTAAATEATSFEHAAVDMVLFKPVETRRLLEVVQQMIGNSDLEPLP